VDPLLEELAAVERAALNRWITFDPQGYLDLSAPEVTYFDPFTERRADGLPPGGGPLVRKVSSFCQELSGPRLDRGLTQLYISDC
jgi:hypothetical protein